MHADKDANPAANTVALTRAFLAVQRAHEQISLCGLALFSKREDEAHEHRLDAQDAAGHALSALIDAGANVPASAKRNAAPDRFDLSALARLGNPDAQELLGLLEHAQEVAERVDAANGHVLPDTIPLQPGESRGTDLAETLSELCLRLRHEVNGPQGREGFA